MTDVANIAGSCASGPRARWDNDVNPPPLARKIPMPPSTEPTPDPKHLLALHEADSSADTAERLCEHTRTALAADSAGVLRHHRSGDTSTASTDSRVAEAQQLQLELDEGPCLDALRDDAPDVVWAADLEHESRWPTWTPRARALGYRSVLSMGLRTTGRRFGSLNVYSARPDAFGVDDRAVAALMAQHASLALASQVDRETLGHALDSRTQIGVATGILMARYDVSQEQAFGVLRRYSQHANVKLREVADRVVETGGLPADAD